jgi:hypothetical protein
MVTSVLMARLLAVSPHRAGQAQAQAQAGTGAAGAPAPAPRAPSEPKP